MTGKHGMTKLLGFSVVVVWTLTVGGCIDGDTGTQGLPGTDGLQGLIGPQGPVGADGPQGLTGPQGLVGPGGTVTQVIAGDGLTGGSITGSGTIALMPGNADGQILRWDNSAGQWFLDTESPRLITYVSGYNVLHQAVGTTETVTGRTVAFTKQYAGSRLRITYSDNLQLATGFKATWEIYLDGAPIANPAPLIMAIPPFWGTASTPARQSTLVGYAEGVPTGAHTISVQVSATTTTASTGRESTFLLEVEEIP